MKTQVRVDFITLILCLGLASQSGCALELIGSAHQSSDNSNNGDDVLQFGDPFLFQLGADLGAQSALITDVTGTENCVDMAIDSEGNVYCAGNTNGPLADLYGGGTSDIFVSKTDQSGVLQWIKHFGLANAAAEGLVDVSDADLLTNITLDDDGNIYCSGYTLSDLVEANGGSYDAFVMKLSNDGALQWLTQLGSATAAASAAVNSTAGAELCDGIAVAQDGSVYCAGYTAGALGEAHGGGAYDAFILKLDASGQVLWLKHFGAVAEGSGEISSAAGSDRCLSLALDHDGNPICAGDTTGNFQEANGGSNDVMLIKLDDTGAVIEVFHIGAATLAASALIDDVSGADFCRTVQVDLNNNIYCAGGTDGDFAETNGGAGATLDVLLIKMNSSFDLQWVAHIGADTQAVNTLINDTSGSERCEALAIDAKQNLACAGYTNGAFAEAYGGGLWDALMLRFSQNSVLRWAKQLGLDSQNESSAILDSSDEDQCHGVAIDAELNVYCSGRTKSDLQQVNTGVGTFDAFISKINASGALE